MEFTLQPFHLVYGRWSRPMSDEISSHMHTHTPSLIQRMRSMVWTERESAFGVISSSSSVEAAAAAITTTIVNSVESESVIMPESNGRMQHSFTCKTHTKLSKEWPKRVQAERSLSYTHIVKCAVRAHVCELVWCWCYTLFKSSLVVIYLFHLAFNIHIAKFIRSIPILLYFGL